MVSYTDSSFQSVIITVLACVILGVVIWCIYTFVRAIFFFIFSGAKEDNKKKWRSSIRFMIIGIILTIILLFLVPSVLKWMNVPNAEVYTPKVIFNKAGDVLKVLFKVGDVVKKSQTDNQYRGDMYYDTTPEVQQPATAGYQL